MDLTEQLLSATSFATSLVIGIPSIDKEHSALLGQLDSLIADSRANPESERFNAILTQLGQQLNAHFVHEEEILKTLQMPVEVVHSHEQAHDAILDQYTALNLDLMRSKTLNRYEVLMMIKGWFISHVVQHDMKIRAYLPP